MRLSRVGLMTLVLTSLLPLLAPGAGQGIQQVQAQPAARVVRPGQGDTKLLRPAQNLVQQPMVQVKPRRKLSMQAVNRYVFRESHSPNPGLPVRRPAARVSTR